MGYSTHPLFKTRVLNKQGKEKAEIVAEAFVALLECLETTIGAEGREMAIVRTKLEEASFFAKKAMASRPENQA